jgi:hypothetical protein
MEGANIGHSGTHKAYWSGNGCCRCHKPGLRWCCASFRSLSSSGMLVARPDNFQPEARVSGLVDLMAECAVASRLVQREGVVEIYDGGGEGEGRQ